MLMQIISIIGAFCLLFAYFMGSVNALSGLIQTRNILNFMGAFLLLIVAWVGQQYGFIILEGAWMIIGVSNIIKQLKK